MSLSPARFWLKVDKRSHEECWPWTGYIDRFGYGKFQFGGKVSTASRVAWKLTHGDPGSLHVCHRCDNPLCCNPAHLFLGTARDNARDRDMKGRAAQRQGADNPRAKLSEADVLAILADRRTQTGIAREYGIGQASVSHIKNGQRWSHLTKHEQVPA